MASPFYHLDTSTVVLFLRAKSPKLRAKINSVSAGQLAVSQVVRAELLVGCLKSQRPELHREQVDRFLANVTVVDFDDSCADHYAGIRTALESAGKVIGPNDLFIAATARAVGAILVTANENEFRRVPGLKVENWS
ncbi:MAG: type II toxin-antitoxin system VapC family toxin [Verrucomicrobia bacterium]|nr:type II toxin-antitoxin system VapC family toxin [Verrucomicrobiota bacterium]